MCETVRAKSLFDENWSFARFGKMPDGTTREEPQSLEQPAGGADIKWQTLNLPHDWAIAGPFRIDLPGRTGKLPYAGIGWYRKKFTIPESQQDKHFFIEFDSAMSHSKVWLNGHYLGEWIYGYTSFQFDLTPHIKFGEENTIAVRLDNPPDSSRWYPGGGIYRHVWLSSVNPVRVAHWGTCITTSEVIRESARIKIESEIENKFGQDQTLTIRHQISNSASSIEIIAEADPREIIIKSNGKSASAIEIQIPNPKLWDLENPHQYYAHTIIEADNKKLDACITPFGIRQIEFSGSEGFKLNGKKVNMKGVCLHHDLGPLGAAIHERAIQRQLELLKEMGCNAIRTSHNPPAPELLDLCDKMGFLVIDETFDTWRKTKTENDYGNHFGEWHRKDLMAMIKRDRNHPSIVMWSTGNEIAEQGDPEAGHQLPRELTEFVNQLDPTRPTTAGCNHGESWKNGFAETINAMGLNYKPQQYEGFHKLYPDRPIYSAESSSCLSSRGEYFFPVVDEHDGGFFNYQVNSYDLNFPPWGSKPDTEFAAQDKNEYVFGEFVWTGFDYLGEPTPYNDDQTILLNFQNEDQRRELEKDIKERGGKAPSRSSYFGILDLCGFKKDRFYLYQANWRPDFPMAHILPHWNWPERLGELTPVQVYTSGDEAELFLNGKSLGRKSKEKFQYRLTWPDIIYEPGELKVIAYKNEKQWAGATRQTTGEAAKLILSTDRAGICSDGRDLSYVTVSVADKKNQTVPRANPKIEFEIEGPGEIVATGNGDATNHESFISKQRQAYNGLCLAIIRSIKNQPGEIKVSAKSAGLTSAEIKINSL